VRFGGGRVPIPSQGGGSWQRGGGAVMAAGPGSEPNPAFYAP